MALLAAFEKIIDRSCLAPRIDAVLLSGVRPQQLSVRAGYSGPGSAIGTTTPTKPPYRGSLSAREARGTGQTIGILRAIQQAGSGPRAVD
jgi:hypothetical protein